MREKKDADGWLHANKLFKITIYPIDEKEVKEK